MRGGRLPGLAAVILAAGCSAAQVAQSTRGYVEFRHVGPAEEPLPPIVVTSKGWFARGFRADPRTAEKLGETEHPARVHRMSATDLASLSTFLEGEAGGGRTGPCAADAAAFGTFEVSDRKLDGTVNTFCFRAAREVAVEVLRRTERYVQEHRGPRDLAADLEVLVLRVGGP